MRKWEDIIKDKMEEPEGALPESVFAEFRARREAASAAPAPKRFPLMWAVVPAVAAGLATVLILHRPSATEGEIQIIQQPLTPVAVVTDSTTVAEPEQTTPLIAQVVTPKVARQAVVKPQEVEIVENVEPAEEDTATTIDDKATQADVPQTDMPDTIDKETPDRPITTTTSPFIPERTKATPVKMKVGPAAGMIAGGGLLAAIIPLIPGAGTEMDNAPMADSDKPGGTVTHWECRSLFPAESGFLGQVPPKRQGLLYDRAQLFPVQVFVYLFSFGRKDSECALPGNPCTPGLDTCLQQMAGYIRRWRI